MEAIYEFEVKDMPITVAVDSTGESVHETGPRIWGEKIKALTIPVRVAQLVIKARKRPQDPRARF